MVVSPEITASRLRRLDRCLQRLRRLAAMPLDAYLADEDAKSLAERHFQVAAQCLLDMANHIIAEEGLGSPDDAEGLLSCLARAGAIPAELYERTKGWRVSATSWSTTISPWITASSTNSSAD